MTDLTGKIALVTGASQGIGRSICVAYAKAGAHVIAVARNKRKLEKLYDEISKGGGKCTLLPLDINDTEEVRKVGATLLQAVGGLDIFVGNAGLSGTLSPLCDIKPDEFNRVMATNLSANFHLIQTLDPLLKQSAAGRVLLVTTAKSVVHGRAYWGTYSISKAALESMARVYADEVRQTNIKVNLIDPGVARTNMRAGVAPGEDPMSIPAPEDIMDQFLYAVSDECSHHGQIIQV